MQNRRFVLWVTVLVLVVSFAVQADTRISWMSWGDREVLERNERIIQAYYEAFPDRDVTVENEVVDWNSYRERLPVWLAGNAASDIISIEGSFMYPQIAFDNVLVDLTPIVSAYADEFAPGTLDAITVDGKIFGFPFHGWDTSPTLFVNYNMDAFNEAALPYPSYDWSWDDLIHFGQKLTQSGGAHQQWGIDFGRSAFIGLWQPALYAHGGSMYAPDRSESYINSPEAADAFRLLKGLDTEYGIQAPPELTANKIGFVTGQVAMTTNWHQEAVAMMDYVRFQSGITLLPQGPEGHGFHPPLTVHSIGVNAATSHPEEAMHFVEWMLTSPDALQAMGPRIPMVPLRSNLPTLVDMVVYNDAASAGWRATEAVFERLMPEPVDRVGMEYPHVIDIVTETLQRYYDSNEAVENFLDNAKLQIDALLRAVH